MHDCTREVIDTLSRRLYAVWWTLPTKGHRTFPVAGARIWNDLPADVTLASTLFTF